jgi:transposase, IS5 family
MAMGRRAGGRRSIRCSARSLEPVAFGASLFKILVIQAQNNLSDDRTEFLINDRLSFMRFLGLGLSDRVPDAKTIWSFRERLTKAGAIKALFARFDQAIREAGYIPMSGQIVDASLVWAPRQRNTAAEKAEIRAGRVPQDWKDKPPKLRQKEFANGTPMVRETLANDARWTLVFGKARMREDGTRHADIAIPVFGYKSHAGIDRRHGFIRKWDVTDASRHDGRMLRRGLLDTSNTAATVWADSACRSCKNEAFLEKHGFRSQVHRRKPKGRAMAPHIRRGNASRSKVRAAVEHVFAQQKGAMGLFVRTVGLARAKVKIGMINLVYNIRRLVWQERRRGLA